MHDLLPNGVRRVSFCAIGWQCIVNLVMLLQCWLQIILFYLVLDFAENIYLLILRQRSSLVFCTEIWHPSRMQNRSSLACQICQCKRNTLDKISERKALRFHCWQLPMQSMIPKLELMGDVQFLVHLRTSIVKGQSLSKCSYSKAYVS